MTTDDFPFFLISDVHGDEEALEIVRLCAIRQKAEGIIILGDICPSSPFFAQILANMPVFPVLVRGNSDSVWEYTDFSIPVPPLYRAVAFHERTILATHGHLFTASDSPLPLDSTDIFASGHTHIPLMEKGGEGPIRLNPGSIARPRQGREGTYIRLYRDRAELVSLSGKTLSSLDLA
jgi:phosphoesterase, MJ0936 family